MSMTAPRGADRCEICGKRMPNDALPEHLRAAHGGLAGDGPGGTGDADAAGAGTPDLPPRKRRARRDGR